LSSFAWLSRYRRLNTIVERSKEHLIAFVEIARVGEPAVPLGPLP
jgi:hypothetical protein